MNDQKVQEQLFQVEPVELTPMEIPLSDLPPNHALDGEPSAELVKSIKLLGVLQPIIVYQSDGRYTVLAGRRRIKAARKAGLKTIPALVSSHYESAITLTENSARSSNLIGDYIAIKDMIRHGVLVEEITKTLGIPKGRIERALKLDRLIPKAWEVLKSGKMSVSTGLYLASKPASLQEAIIEAFKEAEYIEGQKPPRLTKAFAEQFARKASRQASEEIFSNMFFDAWRETVRSHIAAALEIAEANHDTKLAELLYQAIAYLNVKEAAKEIA